MVNTLALDTILRGARELASSYLIEVHGTIPRPYEVDCAYSMGKVALYISNAIDALEEYEEHELKYQEGWSEK